MPIVATLPSFMRHKSESDRRRKAVPAGSGDGRGTGGRGTPWEGDSSKDAE